MALFDSSWSSINWFHLHCPNNQSQQSTYHCFVQPFVTIMSMGWQTESALLPRKAKPIPNVSASSLLGLKAIVSSHESSRSSNAPGQKGLKYSQKIVKKGGRYDLDDVPSRTASTHDHNSVGQKRKTISHDSNNSSRNKPTNEHENVEEAKLRKAQLALAAKAELYEQMRSGGVRAKASLVDFSDHDHDYAITTATSNTSKTIQSISSIQFDSTDQPTSADDKYQWSTGRDDSEQHYLQEQQELRKYQRLLEQTIKQRQQAQDDIDIIVDTAKTISASDAYSTRQPKKPKLFADRPATNGNEIQQGQSRVKTQWEKVLNASTKLKTTASSNMYR